MARETFYAGNLKGVGRVYQQTVIDTYWKLGFAKLYDSKTPITAADTLNDPVVPFFEEHEIIVSRVLTDRGRGSRTGSSFQRPARRAGRRVCRKRGGMSPRGGGFRIRSWWPCQFVPGPWPGRYHGRLGFVARLAGNAALTRWVRPSMYQHCRGRDADAGSGQKMG